MAACSPPYGMGTSKERLRTPVSNDHTTNVLVNEGVFWLVITEAYLKSFFDNLIGPASCGGEA